MNSNRRASGLAVLLLYGFEDLLRGYRNHLQIIEISAALNAEQKFSYGPIDLVVRHRQEAVWNIKTNCYVVGAVWPSALPF